MNQRWGVKVWPKKERRGWHDWFSPREAKDSPTWTWFASWRERERKVEQGRFDLALFLFSIFFIAARSSRRRRSRQIRFWISESVDWINFESGGKLGFGVGICKDERDASSQEHCLGSDLHFFGSCKYLFIYFYNCWIEIRFNWNIITSQKN